MFYTVEADVQRGGACNLTLFVSVLEVKYRINLERRAARVALAKRAEGAGAYVPPAENVAIAEGGRPLQGRHNVAITAVSMAAMEAHEPQVLTDMDAPVDPVTGLRTFNDRCWRCDLGPRQGSRLATCKFCNIAYHNRVECLWEFFPIPDGLFAENARWPCPECWNSACEKLFQQGYVMTADANIVRRADVAQRGLQILRVAHVDDGNGPPNATPAAAPNATPPPAPHAAPHPVPHAAPARAGERANPPRAARPTGVLRG